MILPADHVSCAVISARLGSLLRICHLPWSCVFSTKLPYQVGDVEVCTFPRSSLPMANFAAKYSIMTQEMVDSFCIAFIFRLRIPFTKFFMAVLKYFRVHISQLSPFGAAWVSHFEVLTRVLDLSPSVTVFRACYTRTYSDGLFSFAKRSTLAPSYMGLLDFIKTADLRKVWAVEVQKGDDQVKFLESTQHCFMPLVIPAAGGSSSAAAAEIPAPTKGGQEGVAEEDAYLELVDPDEGTAMVRQGEEEVVTERSKKAKKRSLQKQSDVLPSKRFSFAGPGTV
ncbi:hypothetical protein Tco_0757758 [Tanacetum coccineum]